MIVTADRKADKLPTTVTGAPVATVAPGPLPVTRTEDATGDGRPRGAETATGGDGGVDARMEIEEARAGRG